MTLLTANAAGQMSGKFTVPAGIPAGEKKVLFIGGGGSLGEAIYSGQGTLTRRTYQVETTINETRWESPPPVVYQPSVVTIDSDRGGNNPPTSKPVMVEDMEPQINAFKAWAWSNERLMQLYPDQVNAYIANVDNAYAGGNNAEAHDLMMNGIKAVYLEAVAAGVQEAYPAGAIEQAAATWDSGWKYTKCAVDPLAQTFTLSAPVQISGIDLWFTACGGPVRVDIRSVSAGVPDAGVLATANIQASAVITNGSATRAVFPAPVALAADTEYALVVLANDATTEVAVAELGKWDATAGHWVTSQPYTVGVLLSSSNASTWTAHQDKDLAFRLLAASYSADQRTIALGNVAVTNATDLMLMSYADRPSAATAVEYKLTLPGGTQIAVSDGQAVRLNNPITGNVSVTATLRGTPLISPILHPTTQLASGTVAEQADYITRAIPAGVGARVRVIFDAAIPAGSSINVSACGIDAGDVWHALSYVTSKQSDDGFIEVTHELAAIDEASVRVKLHLSGSAAARPRVRNLRVIIL